MNILVDTGILLRVVIRADPLHSQAREAVRSLRARGDKLIALTQNASEFWNVCTRPSSAKGGYGLSIQDTAKKLRLIERLVEFKPDSLAAFQEWKRLVVAHSITGIQVHDARIASAMNAYGISHILTFNGNDFKRFSGITVVDPKSQPHKHRLQPKLKSDNQWRLYHRSGPMRRSRRLPFG